MADILPDNSLYEFGAIVQINPCAKIRYDELVRVLPGEVSLPSDPVYQISKDSYFSQQKKKEMSPACIVKPLDTFDVATAVKALASVYVSSSHSARFVVGGGGHTPWTGSASVEGGSVTELTSMKAVTVISDGSVVSVGAGAKWSKFTLT